MSRAAAKHSTPSGDSRERLLARTSEARSDAWRRFGTVEDDVITHVFNPSFMGGPRWPAMRQAYRVAREGGVVLLASDGLSDPFDEDEGPQNLNGFEIEVFAASDDSFEQVGGSWLHDLVLQTAQNVAYDGNWAPMLDEHKLVTCTLYDVKIPKKHQARYFYEEETVGVLLSFGANPVPPLIAGPLSPIRLVHLQLLTNDELRFAIEGGAAGRRELADRLKRQGVAPRSRLDRPSVV